MDDSTKQLVIIALAALAIGFGCAAMYYENRNINRELAYSKLIDDYNALVDEHNANLDSIDNSALYWHTVSRSAGRTKFDDPTDVLDSESTIILTALPRANAEVICVAHNAAIDMGFDLLDTQIRPDAKGADAAFETLPFGNV